jgi:predicted glycogen debranching enzyme
MIRFDRSVCGNLDEALRREWLETNGLGGFASSTIAGLNTRRYHGLLMAATHPPAGRALLLSKFEETLIVDGRRYDLSANRYPGTVHPRGFEHLEEFRLDPFPIFEYRAGGAELEKRVFLVQGENTVVVEYELRSRQECQLELRPLVAFRGFHSLTRANRALNPAVEQSCHLASVQPYEDLPRLYFAHNGEAQAGGDWYFNFEYDAERERGLDFREDLFNPFLLSFQLRDNRRAVVIASTEPRHADDAGLLRSSEIVRRRAVSAAAPADDDFVRTLTASADQYIVERNGYTSVIAGYHWFGDWGRDTMIAFTGLTLVTRRFEAARDILRAFARFVNMGMLPNWFPGAGEAPEYNTVDATLWYFEAVRAYLGYTHDLDFVRRELYPVLKDILFWHRLGTRFGIHSDSDGLLTAGDETTQLTWMDARVDGAAITPRNGKAVEIQALWYNALCTMQAIATGAGAHQDAERYRQLAAAARVSFNNIFWNEENGCLFDVVNGENRDGTIRPNQVLAVSLPFTMLDRERAGRVVEVVRRELLTPIGLRTLPAWDPRYHGKYEGDSRSRDSVYHQGTVWPWLMGPFITAYLRVHDYSAEARKAAEGWLRPFAEHLKTAGLGHISEIADGDAPHTPRGCIAQAWSVAELLRAAVEDVIGTGEDAAARGELFAEIASGDIVQRTSRIGH